jgi:ribonucleoside-diphosphate reductase alpha chain
MIRKVTLEEDIALKRLVTTPREQKPDFAWREVLPALERPEIKVTRGTEEHIFNLADVADEIGNALTDLLLSRDQLDIFTETNRGLVANVAHSVAEKLAEQVADGRSLRLSENDLSLLIEKALIENDAHDVAKSLVFSRSARGGVRTSLEDDRPPHSPQRLRRPLDRGQDRDGDSQGLYRDA